MKIIDISWPVCQDTTEYKDRKTVLFKQNKIFEQDSARDSQITMNSHTGTHVDAPSHFLKDGKTIDQVNLQNCIGPCKVLDFTGVKEGVTKADLQKYDIKKNDIILLKTKNSFLLDTAPFEKEFIFLKDCGAQYLADKKIKAVGIDYLGLERGQEGHSSHTDLMKKDIVIIEGLRLGHVVPGDYFFVCLPIRVVGLDAAPARAILVRELLLEL